ncbi:MAG TPA: hypothetical protein VLU25_13365 [Acidobacteriota bacterium]|nr:hypothetical protein [Acidobacteriota bacterium]
MRLEAILICDKVLQESNGKVYLNGIFDRIWSKEVPAAHPEMYLYFRFFVDDEDRSDGDEDRVAVELTTPGGRSERLPELKGRVDAGNKVEGNVRLRMVPLSEYGTYTLRVLFNGKPAGICTFQCIPTPEQEPSAETVH